MKSILIGKHIKFYLNSDKNKKRRTFKDVPNGRIQEFTVAHTVLIVLVVYNSC